MDRKKFVTALMLGAWAVFTSSKSMVAGKKNRSPLVGGGCDGCELMYEGMPTDLVNKNTMPGWHKAGQKLIVQGTIYREDGRTVAPNVILYIYHTDANGLYSQLPGQLHGKRHGHLRGWVKTACDGKYIFYTTLPAPYPERNMPAHIHPVIKEPGINEYYIDEFQFNNDPLLTPAIRRKAQNRGGNGIIKLTRNANGVLICKRDIILGLNIPNYV